MGSTDILLADFKFNSSGSYKPQKRVSRKHSAPAMLCMQSVIEKEPFAKPRESPLDEKARDSSGNSEFEVIPDDIVQHLSEDTSAKETSFTVKIIDEGSTVCNALIVLFENSLVGLSLVILTYHWDPILSPIFHWWYLGRVILALD